MINFYGDEKEFQIEYVDGNKPKEPFHLKDGPSIVKFFDFDTISFGDCMLYLFILQIIFFFLGFILLNLGKTKY